MRGGDDPPALGIVRGVAEIGVARQGEGAREVRRLRRIADEVSLEGWDSISAWSQARIT